MKILVMTDSMHIPSGLGKVGREVALGLQKKGHEIGYIGWFHHPDIPPREPEGMKCWFTNNSHYGADILDRVVNRFQPDVLLTVGDLWRLDYITDPQACKTRRWFQWCSYIAVDGEPVCGGLPPGLVPIAEDIDIPVAYTEYARRAILKSSSDPETRRKVRTIYHGVDTNIFKPAEPAERRAMREKFGVGDKFLFLTVSRNQSRKNIPELLRSWKAFSELPETKDMVLFWPHMCFDDPQGWRIKELLQVLGLNNHSVIYYNQVAYAESELLLIPERELAKLYQIADAFILISGEGFGLPTFEAMASGLPCVLIDYAASSELGADGRAELVHVDGSFTWTGGQLTQRPIPDVDRVVRSMLKVYRDRDYRESIAKKGMEFARQYTWGRVVQDWHMLFARQEVPFIQPMEMEVVS